VGAPDVTIPASYVGICKSFHSVAGNIDITLILSGEKMKRTPCGITWRGHPYCFYPDIHYIHLLLKI